MKFDDKDTQKLVKLYEDFNAGGAATAQSIGHSGLGTGPTVSDFPAGEEKNPNSSVNMSQAGKIQKDLYISLLMSKAIKQLKFNELDELNQKLLELGQWIASKSLQP